MGEVGGTAVRVGIVGAGYVGLVAAACLATAGHDVVVAEADIGRLEKLKMGEVPFFEPGLDELLEKARARGSIAFVSAAKELGTRDVILITVGTPATVSGHPDLSQVRGAVQDVCLTAAPGTVIVMKSTVPPGTGRELIRHYVEPSGRRLPYVSNPEFLREGSAVHDWLNPHRIVVGAESAWAAERVMALHEGVSAPVLVTDITSAEMIKYAANALLATKISFINEIANLCELVGANIDDVARGVGMDPRLGPHFLQAGIGYGGSCFPKDTIALEFAAAVNGYSFELLRAVIAVNRRQRIRVIHRLHQALCGLAGRRVAVLGLAFKPGTDDTRESPGVEIANMLVGHGSEVRTYDPVARLPEDQSRSLYRAKTMLEAVEEAEAVVIATEWDEFRTARWEKVKERMRPPFVVFDGRNYLDAERLNALGFHYIGVGRRVPKGGNCQSAEKM